MKGKNRGARRQPVQRRAKARREAILEATATILQDQGFTAVTTNAVARAAGASIGTVYEYFPNKEALLLALLERYRVGLEEQLGARLGATNQERWQDVVGAVFDAFVEFYRREPGYRELWLGSLMTDLLVVEGQRWGADFSASLALTLRALAPWLAPARAELVMKVAIHTTSALVTTALRAGGDDEQPLIDEARLAVLRYLAPYLDEGDAGVTP